MKYILGPSFEVIPISHGRNRIIQFFLMLGIFVLPLLWCMIIKFWRYDWSSGVTFGNSAMKVNKATSHWILTNTALRFVTAASISLPY